MPLLNALAATVLDLLEGLALASAITCVLYVLSLIARIEKTGPDRESHEPKDPIDFSGEIGVIGGSRRGPDPVPETHRLRRTRAGGHEL